MYVSDWFIKARKVAEASVDRWFILSAKYGLVNPDQMIAPYNQTLNKMPIVERRNWADKVFGQLTDAAPDLTHLVVLAGKRYREFLIPHLKGKGIRVTIPMEGLGIGKQLSWLKKQLLKGEKLS